jgi:hypothetical protein
MATIPPHPINKPHLDQLAGLNDATDLTHPEEVERRVQELMDAWQVTYFSGLPFSSPVAGQADETKTFERLEIMWGRAVPSLPSKAPVLHTILIDRREVSDVRIPGKMRKIVEDWTWNTFVRAFPQLPASAAEAGPQHDSAVNEAEYLCRRAADQYAWLIRSAHAQELAMKGICKLKVASGPRPVQSGAWHLNQLVITGRITYRIRRNSP